MKFFKLCLLAILVGSGVSSATVSMAQTKRTTVNPKLTQGKNETPFLNFRTVSGIDLIRNPNTGTFVITFEQQLASAGHLTLTNYQGKVLHQEQLIPPADSTVKRSIDVGKLKAGLYNIEVKADNTIYWKKVRIRI